MRANLTPLSLAVLAAFSIPALAQQNAPSHSTDNRTLPAVTVTAPALPAYTATQSVTATRTDTPLRDVPQAVTVVTQELIKDQAMQGMDDVIRYTPGVGVSQGGSHRDNPIIRGTASSADFFVNGLRDDARYKRDLYSVLLRIWRPALVSWSTVALNAFLVASQLLRSGLPKNVDRSAFDGRPWNEGMPRSVVRVSLKYS